MSKKPRHLRVVNAESSTNATLPEREKKQRVITIDDLDILSENLEFQHGMALQFRFMQSMVNLSEAGTKALTAARYTLLDAQREIDHIDLLVQSLTLAPQSKKQTLQLNSLKSKLIETRALVDGSLADLETDISKSSISSFSQSKKKNSKTPTKVKTECNGIHTLKLKVLLKGSKPPIWRRILMPGDSTLSDLHFAIQSSMGWLDEHSHKFQIEEEFFELEEESEYALDDLLDGVAKFSYVYDFGDDWVHQITVEDVLHEELDHPQCIGGKRACPPEDTGGIYRYMWMLEVLKDPKHPEFEEVRDWLGDDFDPASVSRGL